MAVNHRRFTKVIRDSDSLTVRAGKKQALIGPLVTPDARSCALEVDSHEVFKIKSFLGPYGRCSVRSGGHALRANGLPCSRAVWARER